MYCPKCRAEYSPGVTRCIDCGVGLVEVLPDAKTGRRDSTDHLVTVLSTHDPGLAAVAESLLQSADIRFSVSGMVLPYPGALPVELQVLAGDADEARRILAELSAPDDQR
jgi:hypothetical protein